jgi:mono/diheme cytochrome c family protein
MKAHLAVALAGLAASGAHAAEPTFPLQDGKSIYEHLCQGCHMPGGKGAVGAGRYPALASNPRLEEPGYPVAIILNGQKAMPPLGAYFSDSQIAEVVNYIRSHFGNRYNDKVTAVQVKTMR